jgi:hypothetical protein
MLFAYTEMRGQALRMTRVSLSISNCTAVLVSKNSLLPDFVQFVQRTHIISTMRNLMGISNIIKSSAVNAIILSAASFSGIAMSTTASHATVVDFSPVDFSIWNRSGDVAPGLGQVNLSTNALQNDDFPQNDSNFNFSGTPAVAARPFPNLQNFLNVAPEALDINGEAFEGSAIQFPYIAHTGNEEFRFSFDFQTNETANDFAFYRIGNNAPQVLTSTANSSGGLTLSFNQPGTFNVAIGVVDTGDFSATSRLLISNAQTNAEPVPEPLTILGSLTALGLGATMRRRFQKQG